MEINNHTIFNNRQIAVFYSLEQDNNSEKACFFCTNFYETFAAVLFWKQE